MTAAAAELTFFSPRLEGLAAEVASSIGAPFNGLHLRLEPDMGLDAQASTALLHGHCELSQQAAA